MANGTGILDLGVPSNTPSGGITTLPEMPDAPRRTAGEMLESLAEDVRPYAGPHLTGGVLNVGKPIAALIDYIRKNPVRSAQFALENSMAGDTKLALESAMQAGRDVGSGQLGSAAYNTATAAGAAAAAALPFVGAKMLGLKTKLPIRPARENLPTDEASRMARGYSGEANTTLAISRQMPDDQATKLIKSRIGQITRDAKLRGAPPSGPYAIEIGALRNRLREIKLAGVGGIAAAGGALSAMGGEARAQEPVNPDDLDPELGMSEQFDRNPLARTGFDPRAVRQLPFKMRGYKAWTSYEDSTNPGLKSIAHGFSRPFSSDDTAMILGIEALPSMDEGGAQLLMHESGHRALRMLNDTEPELVNLVDTLRQPKTDTHSGLDGEEVLMRMLDFFGGNEDRRADTEKFFKQRTGKDIFPVIQENIDTLTQVQAFFQKKLMEQGRNPGSIEFRTPEDIAASPRQNDPAKKDSADILAKTAPTFLRGLQDWAF
jgi:hypothetical protein